MPGPSFHWMSSRVNARDLAAAAATESSRPCLPTIEALGDRILLDAVVIGPGGEQGPPTIDQVLIGMIKGELKLATEEVAALKLAGAEDPQLLHKLTHSFLKIDEVISDVGESLLKGQLTELKENKALEQLSTEFSKIDAILDAAPPNEALEAALGDIKLDASQLLGALIKVEPTGELSHKDQQLYLKINEAFSDLDAGLIKIEEQVLTSARKAGKGQQEYLIIKMNDIIVTSISRLDGQLKQDLTGIVADTEKILIGLLQPARTDDTIL